MKKIIKFDTSGNFINDIGGMQQRRINRRNEHRNEHRNEQRRNGNRQ